MYRGASHIRKEIQREIILAEFYYVIYMFLLSRFFNGTNNQIIIVSSILIRTFNILIFNNNEHLNILTVK